MEYDETLNLDAEIQWHGIGGLTVNGMGQYIDSLIARQGRPDILIIHCGGNDIGTVSIRKLRVKFNMFIKYLFDVFPDTLIVWSQILPRLYWRHMLSSIAAEQTRQRLNNYVSARVLQQGGAFIKYPELQKYSCKLYEVDGVHLSRVGYGIFISTIQGALYLFINSLQNVFPAYY